MPPHKTPGTKRTSSGDASPAVVYQTVCQNPGCGNTFELRVTARDTRTLAGNISCPRCRRPGGSLKTYGRLAPQVFSAKLIFKRQRSAETANGGSTEDFD